MNLILQNPYRILGLIAGNSAAKNNRQVNRLKQFIEAEQEPDSDFSFPKLGELNRDINQIDSAVSKLDLDADKLKAALFWFYEGNSITDEPSFEHLVTGDQLEATQIWFRLVEKGLNERTASAFFNLGTLKMINGFSNGKIISTAFEEGLEYKLQFLESNSANDFILKVTDETFKISKKDLQLVFLNAILNELNRSDAASINKLIEIITKLNFDAKDDFLKLLVNSPIEQIEKEVENSKSKRRSSKSNALNSGNTLYSSTQSNLNLVSSIVGNSNIKFVSISDKVADEILQCGIEYFKHFKDGPVDPSGDVLKLFSIANRVAIGSIVRQRIKENTESLKGWIEGKTERDKQAKVEGELIILTQLIDEFEDNRAPNIMNADELLLKSERALYKLKLELGQRDELYVGISTRIVSIAVGNCVEEINRSQEKISLLFDNTIKLTAVLLLKEQVNKAYSVMNRAENFEMTLDYKNHFRNNKSSLYNLKNELSQIRQPTYSSSSSSSGGGCYIATMAYGDYDHPQVLILRKFRDEKLSKSALGRWFIKTYYHYSPKLVERLKNQDKINKGIRAILNQIIKLIK